MKSCSVKFVNDSLSFDITKYVYDNQISVITHNVK